MISTWTTKTEFPSYEELFYHPPVPRRGSRAYDASRLDAFMDVNNLDTDEHEGPIRELLEEMREWYIEQGEEVESKLHKVCQIALIVPFHGDDFLYGN